MEGSREGTMEFRLSEETKQRLLGLFPSKIVPIQSVSTDGRYLYLASDESEQNESLVANHSTLPKAVVPGTLPSPAKEEQRGTNGQNRETNIDITESTVQAQNQQLILSSPKSVQPSAPHQAPSASLKPNVTSHQQGSYDELPNLSASQKSEVKSGSTHSTHPEAQHTSSGVMLGSAVSERGAAVEATPSPTKRAVKLNEKKQHTVHCFLHCSSSAAKCSLCETPKVCQSNYIKDFAIDFEEFLNRKLSVSLASANNEDSPYLFLDYIEAHLKAEHCPPPCCSRLWKYCADNKVFYLFQYAPEGLLIHSDSRPNEVGTVVETYAGYKDMELIDSGGFGKVYKYSDYRAVKEEFKRPLITGRSLLFQRIMKLDHPHVIKVLEYLAGPLDKPENQDTQIKCFLSVMAFKNQEDLRKQFTKEEHLTCVLDYMKTYEFQEKFIFRNYTVLFQHVFEGLCYLEKQGIVHRDIKSSNILVHQACKCQSPLQCMCAGDGNVTYLLGDMDLLSLEEESANLAYTLDEWEKMAGHDPAGTIGMKPPESFFRSKKGEHVTTHKSDVWCACVTMMNVLIGKAVNTEAQEQISLFITAATEGTKTAAKSVTDSSTLLQSILTTFESVLNQMKKEQSNAGLVNNEMIELSTNLSNLQKMLVTGETSLQRLQSFQGGSHEIYREKDPLAGILTTAYGAQVLHWKCLKKLKHIYGTQLWTVMKQTIDVIVAGIKFVPDTRQDATQIINDLEKIPRVECSPRRHTF